MLRQRKCDVFDYLYIYFWVDGVVHSLLLDTRNRLTKHDSLPSHAIVNPDLFVLFLFICLFVSVKIC